MIRFNNFVITSKNGKKSEKKFDFGDFKYIKNDIIDFLVTSVI